MIRIILRIFQELLWYDWQLVGILEEQIEVEVGSYRTIKVKCYFRHYESRWGTRFVWVKIGLTAHPIHFFAKRRARNLPLYQTQVKPWLRGRNHSAIPAFQKVKSGKWDFTKRLKGQTPVVLNDDE